MVIENMSDTGSDISIVIQGAINKENVVTIANNLRHWRSILPESQIIISVSSRNINLTIENNKIILLPEMEETIFLKQAINSINVSSDVVIDCAKDICLPLPNLKKDIDKKNNINLQISAAKKGISVADRRFILRIRNDIIFMDTTFIKYYEKWSKYKRGKHSIFKNRIMVCSLYTVNPYGRERMPLHISDWFNFGLLSDIKEFWDVKLYSLCDSVYYNYNRFTPGTNLYESEFNSKFAAEQYNAVEFFSNRLNSQILNFHNEIINREYLLELMIDNFFVCDPLNIKMFFPKYENEFFNINKRNDCITQDCWEFLCSNRNIDYAKVLSGDVDRNIGNKNEDNNTVFIRSHEFRTNDGVSSNKKISIRRDGRLFFGPYINISSGNYQVKLFFSDIIGNGNINLSVIYGQKKKLIKKLNFDSFETEGMLKFNFLLNRDVELFEIICDADGFEQISFEYALLSKIHVEKKASILFSSFFDLKNIIKLKNPFKSF